MRLLCCAVQEKKVSCQSVVCDGALCSVDEFLIDYDHLIVSVGQAPLCPASALACLP